jgi:hypothetical protein
MSVVFPSSMPLVTNEKKTKKVSIRNAEQLVSEIRLGKCHQREAASIRIHHIHYLKKAG